MVTAKPDATASPRPGDRGYLKWYWTVSAEGRAKWVNSPHPWDTLRDHLVKHMEPKMAARVTSQWFHDVFGIWSGERKGKNPAGRG